MYQNVSLNGQTEFFSYARQSVCGIGLFGLGDSIKGLFSVGRFGLETFRSDYGNLQKSYMFTF